MGLLLHYTDIVLTSGGISSCFNTKKKLVLDKPYVVLLWKARAKMPYFSLYIANSELMEKFEEKKNPEKI